MDNVLQDVRYGLRMLVKNPALTAVAAISLALGMGANTTIFSLINAAFLRPLPVEKPHELIMIYTSDFSGPAHGSSSYPDYLDIRDKTGVFSGVLASSVQPLSMSSGGQTERVSGEIVTGNYFSLLGVKPVLGRNFLPEEDQTPGAHPVALVSYGLWQRRFGSDPNVVGQLLTLNGEPVTIVGVAPDGFPGLQRMFPVDLWIPMMTLSRLSGGRDRLSERGSRWLTLVGRLGPAATVAQAQTSLTVLAGQLKETYGSTWVDVKGQGRRITAVPESKARVHPRMRGDIAGFMGLLMAVVGLVLLIACANVANLLLARATGRQKEIAIRLSLGAGRARLVRQLLTESILLSLLAGGFGLLIAFWTSNMLLAFKPPIAFPITLDLTPDIRVLGFTGILSLLTGVIFGLAPALQTSRPDLVPALKDEAGAFAMVQRRPGMRNAFVVTQFALSLLLLIGAGLFLRSLRNAYSIDPGFDPDNVLTMSVNLQLNGYSETRGKQFSRQLSDRLQELPGVISATLSAFPPLTPLFGSRRRVVVAGYNPRPGEDMEFHYNIVGPEYFQTLRIPLLSGRAFTVQDGQGAPGVLIVNETFARRFWPGQDPLGKRLSVTGPQGTLLEVIGIARDGKYITLGEDPKPFFYLPALQHYNSRVTVLARTAGDPKGMLAGVRQEIRALDPNLPVTEVSTLMEYLGVSLYPARAAAALLAILGLVALLLASVGIYGIMSYSVGRRAREIGIRMALGAQRRDVLGLVVGQGMKVIGVGVAMGLAGAFALTRFLSSWLYGISATDPVTFAGTPLLLAGVALVASYLPARRAARVDPIVALRYE
jgi:macrolide transport system ATP-binding/permease protein